MKLPKADFFLLAGANQIAILFRGTNTLFCPKNKPMKVWIPLLYSLGWAFLMNAYPYFMAFVVGDEGWGRAGWAFYFITVPAGVVLILLGLITSLVLFFVRRKKAKDGRYASVNRGSEGVVLWTGVALVGFVLPIFAVYALLVRMPGSEHSQMAAPQEYSGAEGGAGQPAAAPEQLPEGGQKPQPEPEGHSR